MLRVWRTPDSQIQLALGVSRYLEKGSFGSIFAGTIFKCTVPLFNSNFHFQLLGLYHGVLLAGPPSNKHTFGLEKENVTPITVAVKRIDGEPEHLYDLTREASNLKVLWGHRNFVTIYGATQSHELGCLCLVMELVHGCTLNQFLLTHGTAVFKDWDGESESLCRLWRSNEMSWWMEKLRLFREIVIALIVCHREQVYHGDLKGPNILLDRCLVPKMVDFGMSFRHTDVSYLQNLGGSLFWAAPEVIDGHEDRMIPHEVVANPYPSDVYSLGMVLAEIMLDGEIPENFTVENFIADKCSGGCPVSLDGVNTADPLFNERVVDRLKILIDKCCEAERQNRISLGDCLSKLDEIYSNLSSFSPSHTSTQYEKTDNIFSKTTAYGDMVCRFKEQFPHVADYMVFNPSKNMVMDEEENLLVHYFCKLDYAEGVEYILEKSAWDFQPDRDLPYLSLLCVTEESLRTLKYLAASWAQTLKKQLLLLHKACLCNNLEIFQFLLLDVGMDFDTWEVSTNYTQEGKPIHKLAARGKTEIVRLILDNCRGNPDYVNTVVPGVDKTPLYYAQQGGHLMTMFLLVDRGGVFERKTVHRREISDHLVDMKLKPEVVSSGNQPQATGLGSQSKQLHHKKSVSEGEAYTHRILSGFETGSAPEEVISIHHKIDFPYELAAACCKRGYLGILQFLEDCGLSLRTNPSQRRDLHMIAVENGHVDIAEFLFKRGFSVNSPGFSFMGISPLECACGSPFMDPRTRKEMVVFLLKAGADPNYMDKGGYTVMDIASGMESKGSREVVRLLIEAGFDLGKRNRWGEDYSTLVARM